MTENNLIVFLNSSLLISVIVGGCVLLLMYIIRMLKNNNQSDVDVSSKNVNRAAGPDKEKESTGSGVASKASKKKTAEARWTGGRGDKHNYTHPWLLTSLKGHTGQVLDMDFSSNGKYLASCAEDRTVVLWCVRDLGQRERKSLRVNIEYDHARLVCWSPDSKAFIVCRANDNTVEVYKVERRKEGWLGPVTRALTFPRVHEADVIGLGIACTGRFIMTCSAATDLVLWDLRGQQLATIDTYLMNTSCAKITPCGRFIVASGFAPDVKVWEVCFTKSGEFQQVKRAFELSGHTSGVYDVAFDADTSHMATVSKDGTWKLFNTKIEFARGEDPRHLMTGRYKQKPGAAVHIALSPDAAVIVVSVGGSLAFYRTDTGTLDRELPDVFPGGGVVSKLVFDATGRHVLVTGDRHVRVFHNVTGRRCDLDSAHARLRQGGSTITTATRERLQQIIADSESFLAKID